MLFLFFLAVFLLFRNVFSRPVSRYFRLTRFISDKKKWKLFKRNRSFFLICVSSSHKTLRELLRDIDCAVSQAKKQIPTGGEIVIETWLFRDWEKIKYRKGSLLSGISKTENMGKIDVIFPKASAFFIFVIVVLIKFFLKKPFNIKTLKGILLSPWLRITWKP